VDNARGTGSGGTVATMGNDSTTEAPCQKCGSPVRIREERGEMSVTDTSPPIIPRRVCTNPACPTNSSDKGLTDVV
jgi:hypothetical protein